MKVSILDFPPEYRAKAEPRFWAKVEKTESCWIWKGGKTSDGYGSLAFLHDKSTTAHRVSFELTKGRIPENREPDHLCRNAACVNPQHLELVTHRENMMRGNSIQARNARKTHCPRGHPLSGDNLVASQLKYGKRICRSCHKQQERDSYRRHRIRMGYKIIMTDSDAFKAYDNKSKLKKVVKVRP